MSGAALVGEKGLLSVRRPRPRTVDALLREQRHQPFSYPDIGATAGAFPDRYRHVRHAIELGHGRDAFDRAAQGLRGWEAHVRAGVSVRPPDAAVEEGLTVVLTVPVASIHVTVACRVVYVVEEPARSGFAYGTLPHHVIEGEEAFVVERDDRDTVRFRISAFLRPRGPLMAAVGPVVEALDHRIVGRYLRGLQQHVADGA